MATITTEQLAAYLNDVAIARSGVAFGYSQQAQSAAAGAPPYVQEHSTGYYNANISGIVDIDDCLPAELKKSPVSDIVNGIIADLQKYYAKYFPNISNEYVQWIQYLTNAINNGVPVYENNAVQNQFVQEHAQGENERLQYKLRSTFAAKGFALPPGPLVMATYDAVDAWTENAVKHSVATANGATAQLTGSYKQLLSTAIATGEARFEALAAMGNLIVTAAQLYSAKLGYNSAILTARAAAIRATLAYYEAELALDRANTALYGANAAVNTRRFDKNADLFFKNEGAQADAAIAAATQAGMIAQAAFASLNTIVSSSTVSFAGSTP